MPNNELVSTLGILVLYSRANAARRRLCRATRRRHRSVRSSGTPTSGRSRWDGAVQELASILLVLNPGIGDRLQMHLVDDNHAVDLGDRSRTTAMALRVASTTFSSVGVNCCRTQHADSSVAARRSTRAQEARLLQAERPASWPPLLAELVTHNRYPPA